MTSIPSLTRKRRKQLKFLARTKRLRAQSAAGARNRSITELAEVKKTPHIPQARGAGWPRTGTRETKIYNERQYIREATEARQIYDRKGLGIERKLAGTRLDSPGAGGGLKRRRRYQNRYLEVPTNYGRPLNQEAAATKYMKGKKPRRGGKLRQYIRGAKMVKHTRNVLSNFFKKK